MKAINFLKKYSIHSLLAFGVLLTSCSNDDEAPAHEHETEVITDVHLVFTNKLDATDVVEASAKDSDGDGIAELTPISEIDLDVDKTYILTYEILNEEEHEEGEEEEAEGDGHEHGEDILAEIEEHKEEHQFFFSFTNDVFEDPTGTGNIDAAGTINYLDTDSNNLPVGLETEWTTGSVAKTGAEFTVRLMHQVDVKNATSTANDGDQDFELTFVLNIN